MRCFRYFILLISVVLIVNSQTEFDISPLNIDEIHKIEISENGSSILFTYKSQDGSSYVWHNGERHGPLPNFSYFERQSKYLSDNGKYFYVTYANNEYNEAYITHDEIGGFTQANSDIGFFSEDGTPSFAYIDNDQLFVKTWNGVEGPIDSAEFIGNFKIYNDGTIGVSYLHNSEDYIYFNGEITGPLENVSVNSIQFPKGRKLFAYRQGNEKRDNSYVIGEKKFGPYQIGSDHISFSKNEEEWGFIFRKNNEAYVKTSGGEFGPFPNFDFATDLKIVNNDPEKFRYLYMVEKDTALYLQNSNTNKQIDVPSFRIAQPVFSDDGKYYRFIIRIDRRDYFRVNDELFGPFDTGDRYFYQESLNSKVREFKFKKHNKAFLKLVDQYIGPFHNFDYQINNNKVSIGYIDPDMKTVGIKSYSLDELDEIEGINKESNFNYSVNFNDKQISFDIPFNWSSLNLQKITGIFPGILLHKNDLDVAKFVDNLLENGKIELTDNKVVLVSAQGKYSKDEDLLKLVNEQINQLKDVSIAEEPSIIDFKNKSIAYAGLIAGHSIYAKLGWFFVDDELFFVAVYQTHKPEQMFDETDWEIISSIEV